MKALYDLDQTKLPYIDGVEYPFRHPEDIGFALKIFSVPEKNAVGTNSLYNGISLVKFNKHGGVQFDLVARDFVEQASGGEMVFIPPVSDDTIGYSQTRGFLLFNLKTKQVSDFSIKRHFGITIKDIAVFDGKKRLFLFLLQYNTATGPVNVLKLTDLSTDEVKELATYDIDKHPIFANIGKTTFHFSEIGGRKRLHALNERLQPIEHPLLSVYNRDRDPGRYELPIVHPSLPFAICELEEPGTEFLVSTVSWRDATKPAEMYRLFDKYIVGGFQFSPDGKWALFRHQNKREPLATPTYSYVVMPVDPALPHYLGPPILLRSKEKMSGDWNGKCAWIADPLSVVCSFADSETDLDSGRRRSTYKLIKWEISKDAVRKP